MTDSQTVARFNTNTQVFACAQTHTATVHTQQLQLTPTVEHSMTQRVITAGRIDPYSSDAGLPKRRHWKSQEHHTALGASQSAYSHKRITAQ